MVKRPSTTSWRVRLHRDGAGNRKRCVDCAKSIDARARLCPECKQPQDWRRWLGGFQMLQSAVTILAAAVTIYVAVKVQDLLKSPKANVTISKPVCDEANKFTFSLSNTGKNEAEIVKVSVMRHEQMMEGPGRISLKEDQLEMQSREADYTVDSKVLPYEVTTTVKEGALCDVIAPLPDGTFRKSCAFDFELEYKDRETGKTRHAEQQHCIYDPDQ